MKSYCSEKLEAVHSDIRGPLYLKAMEMEKAGAKVLKINSGNPAIFGHTAPDSIKQALIEGADRAVAYCDFRGMPAARKAICDYHKSKGIQDITEDDIYVGNGVSELVNIALSVLLNEGDEILVPTPCYSLWSNCAYLVGGKPVYYMCDEAAGWFPDIDDIKSKVTSRTKAIVLINPNNPTGALYSRELLEQIADVARQNDLMIFSDEIYDRLLFDGAVHIPMAVVAPDLFVVTMNGLSKSHNICGYRCGWMLLSGPRARSEEFRTNVGKLMSMRLCAGALPQLVIPAALADQESTMKMVSPGGKLYERRKATLDAIAETDALITIKNSGALYMFPKINPKYKVTNDKEFARELLERKHILLVPGSGFNFPYPDHFRIVMLPSPEELSGAVKKIAEVLDEVFL